MLKPKKKITKKEIKKDPFLEAIYNFQNKFKENKTLISRITFGVVVLIAVVLFLNNKRLASRSETETALGQAIVSLETGDLDNAKFQLELLLDDHGSTASGIAGRFFLGKIYYDEHNYSRAEHELSTFVKESSNQILLSSAYRMLADIYLEKNQITETENSLKKSLKYSNTPSSRQSAMLKLADFLRNNGQAEKAKDLVNSILVEDKLDTRVRQQAEEMLGRLSGT